MEWTSSPSWWGHWPLLRQKQLTTMRALQLNKSWDSHSSPGWLDDKRSRAVVRFLGETKLVWSGLVLVSQRLIGTKVIFSFWEGRSMFCLGFVKYASLPAIAITGDIMNRFEETFLMECATTIHLHSGMNWLDFSSQRSRTLWSFKSFIKF